MIKKRFRKVFVSLVSLGSIAIVPTVLTSCSSISSTLLDELVSKGNGLQLTNSLSLSDLVSYSLSTDSGNQAWFSQLVNQAIYGWLEKISGGNSQSSNKDYYARLWSTESTTIDDDYDDTYDNSKKANGSDTPLVFQQDELDPKGGTEDSWKKEEWLNWASSTFETDLFSNLYLSIVDQDGNYVAPTEASLQDAIIGSNNYSFKFTSSALNKSVDSYVASEYASFQQFIFDQWVQSENPFIINYLEWGYATPKAGLDSIYDADAIGKTATTTDVSGSYSFPYFGDEADNDALSDIQKFTSFIDSGTTNTDTNGIGLTDINKNDYSSDTSTSYKLVTNATSYSDLSASLALGATYLFSTAYQDNNSSSSTTSSTGVDTASRSKLTKTVTTTTSGPFDVITANFIVTSQDSLKNSTISQSSDGTYTTTPPSTDSYIPYTQLSDSYVKSILSASAYTTLSSTNGLYSIDAFIPTNSGLNNVLFLRDSDGVYAITLDGEQYISQATSLSDAKTRAGKIVMYRYLQNEINSSVGLSIDLSSTLNTFYTNNKDWLIYKYVQTQSNQNLFDFSFITNDSKAKTVFDDLTNYLYIKDRYQRIENYQTTLSTTKSSYSENYGDDLSSNGLAAQYPYEFVDASSSSGTIGYYEQLKTLKLENPFTDSSASSIDFSADPYATNGIYQKLSSDIQTYTASLTVYPLTSSYKGFQYSQYIFTDDFFLNEAILAVGNDGTLLSDLVKKNILLSSINSNSTILTSTDYLSTDSYNVNSYIDATSGTSTDVSSYINSALSNYFFNSTFDNSSNKWIYLEQTNSSLDYSNNTSSFIPTITYTNLDDYRKNMWITNTTTNNVAMTSTGMDNYVSFLTVIATINWLAADNGANFVDQLETKLSTADSKLSYLVWENSVDQNNLYSSDSTATAKTLLYGDDGLSIAINVNNSQSSAYYPSVSNLGTYVDKNNQNSTFIDSTHLTNYYTHVAKMHSFQGLETNASNSSISTTLENTLFNDAYTDSSDSSNALGLLYGIASSRSELVSLINSYSSSQIISLANTIQTLFPSVSISSVTAATSTENQRNELIEIVNNTSLIPNTAFQPKNGYINSGNLYTSTTDSVSGYQYGSYVIQLNSSDLSDGATFINYLTSVFNSNNPADASSSSTNSDANDEALSLYWNLLVELATDSSIQSTATTSIATVNKVTVYDVRLNNQLGSRWVINYKDKSSSSSSSS